MKSFQAVISTFLLTLIVSCTQVPGRRAQQLQRQLQGSNRMVVSEVFTPSDEEPIPPFSCTNQAAIAELIANLTFDDRNSGFHCMCCGDSLVTFFKGTNVLAEVSHHHGRSLRWKGWKGDSKFTDKAAAFWRSWFLTHGEARFENMYQEEVSRNQERERITDLFLSAFPEGTGEIIDQAAKASDYGLERPGRKGVKQLEALFPERNGLAEALAQSLGILASEGAGTGSWSTSSSREQLVLQVSESLTEDEFRTIAGHPDPIVRLGAARLFFFEAAYRKLPQAERAPTAANLCRTTLDFDRCGNADIAIRALKRYPCKESTQLLEELAGGELELIPITRSWKHEPAPRFAGCVILAYTDSPKTSGFIEALEKESGLDEFDSAALKVARALLGDIEILDETIFEPNSYTIGCGALDALERDGGKAAVELVIMAGTKHSWAAVRDDAVDTAARMTGQKWNSDERKSAEEARAWWAANRDTYSENRSPAEEKP